MPAVRPLQTNLTAGELAPELLGRPDLPIYGAGAQVLENVLILPQGGVERRPGFRYVSEVPEYGKAVRLVPFEFSDTELYLFVCTHQQAAIYRNGIDSDALEQTLALPSFTRTNLPVMNWTQSHDTLLLFDGNGIVQPQRVVRDTTQPIGSQFTIADAPLVNIPNHPFDDALSPAEVDEVQRISFAGPWASEQRFRLRLDNLYTQRIGYATNTAVLAARIQTALQSLASTSADGITAAVVAGPTVDIDVTFGGDDGNRDWPLILVELVDDTDGLSAVAEQTKGASKQEPVWSAARGWPRCGVFHESRLWLGNSLSRPATIWGSRIGEFYDYALGDALDTDAIAYTVSSDTIEYILHLASSKQLEVYTTRSEYYVPERPITPTNFTLKRQSSVGAANVRPAIIDEASIFVDHANRGLHEFRYGALEDNYETRELSLVAQHLIGTPTHIDVQHSTRGDYAWITNLTGPVAVLNRKNNQELAGFTRVTTAGQFKDVATLYQDVYAVIDRNIGGVNKRFLERLVEKTYTDANLTVYGDTFMDTWNGFEHLEGATVEVKANGYPEGTQVVVGGQITTQDAVRQVEVGLPYTVQIRPMPITVAFANGNVAQRKRRIGRVTLMLQDSQDVYVDGYRVADRLLGARTFENPQPLLTGNYDTRRLGWSTRPEIEITQQRPMPLKLLAIGYEVDSS